MILQALYQLAHDDELMDDPDFEMKPVAWLITVGPEGRFEGIQETHYAVPVEVGTPNAKKKPKSQPKVFPVPRESARTSGDRAFLLCDKAEYALGLDPLGERPAEKLAIRFELFRERVKECLDATNDEGVRAVHEFLQSVAEQTQFVQIPDNCATNDLFAFMYSADEQGPRVVHQREAVREFWKAKRVGQAGSEALRFHCLVSGALCDGETLFPGIKKLPGGSTSGVSLVSFNSGAFESHGWRNNQNAAISRDAAEAAATALNRLVHPAPPDPLNSNATLPRLNLQLTADTTVCYWAPTQRGKEFASAFSSIQEAREEQVPEQYKSIWRGVPPAQIEPAAFYVLTLTGTQGRAIVRDWLDSSLASVVRNVAQHFADLQIVRNTPKPKANKLPPALPLRALLASLAPFGKRDEIPAALAADLFRSALTLMPYPLQILQRSIERSRAEIGQDDWAALERRDARAALIKAVLIRAPQFKIPSLSRVADDIHWKDKYIVMNPESQSEGYALGRLMAVLERLQQEALENVNASVIDRYFAGASASPRSVFTRLLNNARHHVRKLRDDSDKAGLARRLERLIDELVFRFVPKSDHWPQSNMYPESQGFPIHLSLEQQGLFILGYHHMRKWLWMNREERQQWEDEHPGAARAFLWAKEKVPDISAAVSV